MTKDSDFHHQFPPHAFSSNVFNIVIIWSHVTNNSNKTEIVAVDNGICEQCDCMSSLKGRVMLKLAAIKCNKITETK